MLYSLRASLRCPQVARRCFSSHGRHFEGSEKDFRPKKALLVRKVTRYEYEKFYLKPELSETQLQDYVRNPDCYFMLFGCSMIEVLFTGCGSGFLNLHKNAGNLLLYGAMLWT